MAADEKGLVHGGFIFSAADYCAMLTVNHQNVVLAKAEVKFLKPAKVGESLRFVSTVLNKEGKKWQIEVEGYNEKDEKTFTGLFFCVVTEKHVLD
jgi:acyl-coenzyme A thioesterase PaaI-like protein